MKTTDQPYVRATGISVTIDDETGAIVTKIEGDYAPNDQEEPYGTGFKVNAQTFIADYSHRFEEVRERNPDMDTSTVRQTVLQKWLEEIVRKLPS